MNIIIKILLLLSCLSGFPLLAQYVPTAFNVGASISPSAVIAADQNANTTGSSITSLVTLKQTVVPAGSAIVVGMRAEVGTCPTYNNAGGSGHYWFTDSASDTFSAVGCVVGSGSAFSVMMGYVCNSAGSTTMTFTGHLGTAEAYVSVYPVVISNAASSSCLDVEVSGTAAAATSITSSTFSTAQANEIAVVLGSQTNTGIAFGAGSGATFIGSDVGAMGAVEAYSYTSTQTNTTAKMNQVGSQAWGMVGAAIKVSNGTIAAASGNAIVPYIAGNDNVSGIATSVTIPSAYNGGSGVPVGHGTAIWAANNTNTSVCGGTCVLKVTDSESNTCTTSISYYDSSFIINEYVATCKITTALSGSGSDSVTCTFYESGGTVPIPSGTLYCRVFDVQAFASVDSSGTPFAGGGTWNGGALTVSSGTDIIFAIVDHSAVPTYYDQCAGYNEMLGAADGGGGSQQAISGVATNGVTPCGVAQTVGSNIGFAISIVP